jgi:flavin-dependent dehydrogenase
MDRGDSWQVGYILRKGTYQRLRAAGIAAFRQSIAHRAPWLRERTAHLRDWRQTSLLVIEAGRVQRWYRPGLLLIGDAAHVMSPVFGVGVNFAIQDAIVAANVLGRPLLQGSLRTSHLARVQYRRALPTRLMQLFQRQERGPAADGRAAKPPWASTLMHLPVLADLRGRLIACGGWKPEKVRDLPGERTPTRQRLLARSRATEFAGTSHGPAAHVGGAPSTAATQQELAPDAGEGGHQPQHELRGRLPGNCWSCGVLVHSATG